MCCACVGSGAGVTELTVLCGPVILLVMSGATCLHCISCFSVKCSSQQGCPVVQCPDCLTFLHSCKLNDHIDFICPNHLVPCCNNSNGCEVFIKRSTMGIHLEHCPASIIQCRYAYYRYQQQPRQTAADSIDSLSLSEKFLQSDFKLIDRDPKCENVHYTPYNKRSTTIECSRINSCSYQFDNISESFYKGRKAYISKKLHQYHSNIFAKVHTNVFICGLYVRRKDFSDHMKKHDDICTELSFKIRQCPLYLYGCDFNCVEIEPWALGYTLDYNPIIDLFFTRIKFDLAESNVHVGHILLSSLPVEMLVYIVSYLDCYSMWSLSQTCLCFRDICEGYLSKKGIVYCEWKKQNGKWTNTKLVCTIIIYYFLCTNKNKVYCMYYDTGHS